LPLVVGIERYFHYPGSANKGTRASGRSFSIGPPREDRHEEAMVGAFVNRMTLATGQAGALFILDHELGAWEGDSGL
jgi:hypothetical protein